MAMAFLSGIRARFHLILENLNFSRRLEMNYLIRRIRRYLPDVNGAVGIDIACGLGNLTRIVAIIARSRVLGVDVNPQVVDIGQRQLGSSRLAFLVASSDALPFRSTSFEFATSICAFEHFANDRQSLAEVNRALKPGAYFFLTVDSLSHPDVDEDFRCLHKRACHVSQYYSRGDIRTKLEAANFEVIDTVYLLRGNLASRLSRYGLTTNFGKTYLILSAIVYPLVFLEEHFTGGDYGYKLGVTARKPLVSHELLQDRHATT
jgi:ubiquinone/menaquinone biosynthesis C-methylase UbiE